MCISGDSAEASVRAAEEQAEVLDIAAALAYIVLRRNDPHTRDLLDEELRREITTPEFAHAAVLLANMALVAGKECKETKEWAGFVRRVEDPDSFYNRANGSL